VEELSHKQVIVSPLPWYKLVLPFSERRMLLFFGDLACLLIAVLGAYWMQLLLERVFPQEPQMLQGQMSWLFVLAVVWVGMALVNECYDVDVANRPVLILQGLLVTFVGTLVLYLLIFFILGRPVFATIPLTERSTPFGLGQIHTPPRIISMLFLVTSLVLFSLWRVGYIRLLTNFPLQRRAIVVGAGWAGRALVQALRPASLDYRLVGFIDDDPEKQGQEVDGLPVLGNRYDLLQQVKSTGASEVILAITHDIHGDLLKALMDCYERGITIRPMSLLYEDVLGRVPVQHLGQRWLPVSFWGNNSYPTLYGAIKRLMDILLGLSGLLVFAVVFPLVALALYIDSPGPIFYVQERLGKGGKPFRMIKLRSMIHNAEKEGKAVWATHDDARVTRVGKFLRRTRLDEFPQIVNVLKGEMSIVGPRPERPQFVAQLQEQIPFYRARLSVRPGLTGWAQIKYRYGNTVEDALIKLQYDLYYIKHRSLLLDILIILRTIKVMLMLRGI